MCATMIDRMGLDPSFLIGGTVEGYDTNGKNGDGEYFVVEADESDGSFLYLNPHVVIVTNVEADHMDHYSSLEEIEDTFCAFMSLVGEDGTVIVCGEDPHLVELARSTGRAVLTYGEGEGFDVSCAPMASSHAFGTDFRVTLPTARCARSPSRAIPVATTCSTPRPPFASAYVLGLDTEDAARALSTFQGASPLHARGRDARRHARG